MRKCRLVYVYHYKAMAVHRMLVLLAVAALHTSNGSIGYFWHVTDLHYDYTYHDLQLSCDEKRRAQPPGQFGDMWCDSPWTLVKSSVQAMAVIRSDVDFILWSGDTVLHADVDKLSYKINAEILDNVTELLKTSFPGKPVYATLGNNDYWPDDQFPAHNNRLYNDTLERWREWIGDPSQDENFRKGAYYSVVIQPGLRLVALNTNLYYRSNRVVLNVTDPGDQLHWLNATLQNSETRSEKVLLTAHIPPGLQEGRLWWHETYYKQFVAILRLYADVIVGMHAGHHHSDAFKILFNTQGQPAVPIFLAPSVTPWRYVTPSFDGPAHNPGVRFVSYHRQTGTHIEIAQYYLDLAKANADGKAEWRLEYRTSDAYSIVELTPRALFNLAGTMKSASSSAFKQYWRYHNVSPPENLRAVCDSDCHASLVCAITEFGMDAFEDCKTELIHVSVATCTSMGGNSVLACVSAITVVTLLFV